MSEFKVSFSLLKQQIEELKKVATQMQTLAEKVSTASTNLGQDELLASARSSLVNSASNIGSKAELLAIASATLGEIIEEYTGTETKNVTRAEGTKAHSRDFYKNPVVISDAAGEGTVAGVYAGAAASAEGAKVGAAGAVMGAEVGAAGAVMGAEAGAAGAVMGAEVGSAATVAGAEAATAATLSGVDAGASSSLGGVALGAGVAAAGAAVGAAGIVGGIKLSKSAKEKKEKAAASQPQETPYSPQNTAEVREAEDALKKAQEKLDNI